MSNKPSKADVGRSRAGMATLLTKAVEMTRKLERRLDVSGGWREARAQTDVDADPTATLRIIGALLLRKARIHTVAVLRANETSNLHSLAVQMRPVLKVALPTIAHHPDGSRGGRTLSGRTMRTTSAGSSG